MSRPKPIITTAEWTAELQRLMSQPRKGDAGTTVAELSRATGWSNERVCRAIRTMPRDKLVVGRQRTTDIAGRPISVPCYRFTKA